ncbi:hypothetical protein BAE44_0012396 [Dichanthelium oligosanthes]|uniref:SIAH-type domain-containing protein n=1 Tax=Dichanthelium oligosanthes TaxID=888268 RepID=A0A1E5VN81_9POAL|nr:hypothetical protein BAE44_0012396 [Dichanthelium oligosanthes]
MEQTSPSGGKKLKVDVPGGAGGQVKQEVEMEEANVGGAGVGELVAVDGATTSSVEVTVRFDKAKLHCPLCTLPLKPPIFQCDAGRHLACSACNGLLSGNKCYACGSGGSYGRNPELEDFLRSARIPCPYDVYGCRAHVAYCDADEHQRKCPCAPCCCPERERGCRFVGSPPMLLDHIAAEHSGSSPVVAVCYGQESNLTLTAARRWHALVGQEDRSLFLVSLAAPCSYDTAVSLVCVRANNGGSGAAGAPRYTCRLALELPNGGGGEEEDDGGGGGVVVMKFKVRSSALPGGTPALDQRAFLGLHQQLHSGDTLALSVRIDRLQPVGAATAAPNTTTIDGKPTWYCNVEANEGGAAAPAAVEGTVTVRIYKANLDCPLCTLPLKPPIFQRLRRPARRQPVLRVCNTALEDYLRAVTIPCPYDVYGCRAYVAYCDADDHRRECPGAPCCCPEPGCPFSGSPRMLLAHIAGEHATACPVPVAYGRERRLMAQLVRRWHAVVGEEDGSLFLVSLCALGAVTAVSLVCLRANAGAAAAAQYKCRLALELPGGGGGEDGRVASGLRDASMQHYKFSENYEELSCHVRETAAPPMEKRECPCAPCGCSESGCSFVGSPLMLCDHLRDAHGWPVDKTRYGRPQNLRLPESQRRCLLIAEEDECVLLVVAMGVPGECREVSLLCLRESAAVGPQYTSRMWAMGHMAAGVAKVQSVMMEVEVPSCTVPGEAAAVPLVVHRKMLHRASTEIHLSARINKELDSRSKELNDLASQSESDFNRRNLRQDIEKIAFAYSLLVEESDGRALTNEEVPIDSKSWWERAAKT